MDVGHHVDAVHLDDGVTRGAQGGVQHRASLGDVDRRATEHRVASRLDVDCLGQRLQQRERLVVHPVLGVVDGEAGDIQCHAIGAARVVSEELAQMDGLERVGVAA